MTTLSAFTKRRLIIVVVFTLLSGAFVVSATKWAVDVSFPQVKTATTQQSHPQIGDLMFSGTLVAENEVMLNLTFSGKQYITQAGFVWTVWLSSSIIGFEANLSEGLMLVAGTIEANSSSPLPNHVLSLQARVRATMDGEWAVYGRFSATRGPGEYYGISAGGIRISVSNSKIVQLEKVSN